jgi:CRISPR-associated protein Csd1
VNWTAELLDLYQKNESLAGKAVLQEGKDPLILLPIYHSTVKAQVTVTLLESGEFHSAEIVPKKEGLTIIPVTEESGSRTRNNAPHPLCDKLYYLAGDFMEYWQGKDDFTPYHETYINNLRKWVDSPYTHKKVNSILQYLSKSTLIKDLVNSEILHLGDNGDLSENIKIEEIKQTDALIRFQVYEQNESTKMTLEDNDGSQYAECWLDRSLQKKYIEYVRSESKEKQLSYLTGDLTAITYLHPRKIRNEGDQTKLFSSNDKENYTFRGRFKRAEEAYAIGYEESHKIHSALKWIIRKQGLFIGNLSIVVWDSDSDLLPKWHEDTMIITEEYQKANTEDNWESWRVDEEEGDDNQEEYLGTNKEAARNFRKAIWGYKRKIRSNTRTVLLALDSASTGRLSLVEYRTYEGSRYVDNLEYWHKSASWIHKKATDQGVVSFSGIPGIYEIARLLYGTYREDKLILTSKDKIYKELCKRLLPCITDRKKLPVDLLQIAMHKASSPQSFRNSYHWEAALTLACSFIKKQRYEEKKEVWDLGIKEDCTDRDYLYGRLLAVADWIEHITMDKEDKRETNGKRYMSAFSKRPYMTWKIIEEKLQPYQRKLKTNKFEMLLDEILNKFSIEDFANNQELNGLYLLGYHQQLFALKQPTEKGMKAKEANGNE